MAADCVVELRHYSQAMFRRAFLIAAAATALVPVGLLVAAAVADDRLRGPLAVGGGIALVLPFTWLVLALVTSRWDRSARQLSAWTPARATIRSVRSTASRVGASPVIIYELDVQGPVGPEAVRVRQLTPPPMLQFAVSGTIVPVRCDPSHPGRVAIDWRAARESVARNQPPADLTK